MKSLDLLVKKCYNGTGDLMIRFRRFFGKKEKTMLVIGFILALFYTIRNYQPGILLNITNIFFIVGIFHVMIGLWVYVQNVGLFKIFTYRTYRWKFKRTGQPDPTVRPLSFADYAIELANNQRSIREYFIVGMPFLVLSFILAFISF